MRGFSPKKVSGRILTGPAITSHNTFAAPDVVTPKPFQDSRLVGAKLQITLPARSIVVLELD